MTTTAFDDQFTPSTQTIESVHAPYGVDDEAANRIALAVYDCKNGINPEPLLYAINRILGEEVHPLSVDGQRALLQSSAQAPAVPAEIIELSKKYAIDTEAYHAAMDALLQSAEVRHD